VNGYLKKQALNRRYLLGFILLFHTLLGVLYSVTVPPWEAHDEIGHYYFARYLATEHHLPPPGTKVIQHNDESHQPPLYYALVALATAWIDTDDNMTLALNPHAATEGGEAGANMVVHDLELERFPYQGTILALHIARLVSVALSTLGLVAVYKIGRSLFPTRPELALGATAINAFWPQYLFIGSVVTNDIMVTICASWFFLFLIRIVCQRSTIAEGPRIKDWIGMGLSLGAALLSKNNGLALLPLAAVGAAIAVAQIVRQQGLSPHLLSGIATAGSGLLAIAGWWYARNMLIYGKLFGHYQERVDVILNPFVSPLRPVETFRPREVMAMLRYGFITFWASFGWGNVEAADSVYILAGAFCTLGTGGLLYYLAKRRERRLELLLLGFAIISFMTALSYLNLKNGSAYLRGRICLPVIAPVSLLLAVGCGGMHHPCRARWMMSLIAAAMAIGALLLPFWAIMPTYARPPQLTPEQVHAIPHPVNITFGQQGPEKATIQLMGYEIGQWRVKPGERLPVTLYWRALGRIGENYTLAVKVIGADGEEYGALHLFPGRGNFATSLWEEGDAFRETYQIPIAAPATMRVLARVSVGFFCSSNCRECRGIPLQVYNERGETIGGSALIGRVKIAGRPPHPILLRRCSFQVGDRILLTGYDLPKDVARAGTGIELTLYWEAQGRIPEDYTVFVHVVNDNGEIVAQGDAPPSGGNYPTSLWEAGEIIKDGHFIHLPQNLPSGRYRLFVGLYNLHTMARLPALTPEGKHLMNSAIPIGHVQVRGFKHWIYLPYAQREAKK